MARSTLTGSRIRQRRGLVGLGQAELARRLGVSASYLNLIEHNRRRVAPDLLERVAHELGVDAAALSEGADAALMETLRDAAATVEEAAAPLPEIDRLEELAGRFPGWAALIEAQHRRLAALERTVERLTDRMTHDPHLSASLHEVLSVAASLRSTAAILAETEDIDPAWRARFLHNLHGDSLRLTEGAQALVGYLEASQDDESGIAAPQEELEAWLAERDYHVAELEGPRPTDPEALVEGQTALASRSARQLALGWLRRYRRDAEALPMRRLLAAVAAHGADPERLATLPGLGGDLACLFRRLASLPPGAAGAPSVGLVICDASGTMTFRKPVSGFGLPRFGAACPLWPLFQSLAHPLWPLRSTVEMAGRVPQKFETFAICEPRTPPGFGAPQVLEASMLILPVEAEPPAGRPATPVGTSCRICPRPDCAARREPSIVAQGFAETQIPRRG
jgi:transcriptional regulator with XRE-family HTH domain